MDYADAAHDILRIEPRNDRHWIVARTVHRSGQPGINVVLEEVAAERMLLDMAAIAEAWGLGRWEDKR